MRLVTSIIILHTLCLARAAHLPRNFVAVDRNKALSPLGAISAPDSELKDNPREIMRVSASKGHHNNHISVQDQVAKKRQIHNADYSTSQRQAPPSDNSNSTTSEHSPDKSPKSSEHDVHHIDKRHSPSSHSKNLYWHAKQSAPVHSGPRSIQGDPFPRDWSTSRGGFWHSHRDEASASPAPPSAPASPALVSKPAPGHGVPAALDQPDTHKRASPPAGSPAPASLPKAPAPVSFTLVTKVVPAGNTPRVPGTVKTPKRVAPSPLPGVPSRPGLLPAFPASPKAPRIGIPAPKAPERSTRDTKAVFDSRAISKDSSVTIGTQPKIEKVKEVKPPVRRWIDARMYKGSVTPVGGRKMKKIILSGRT